MTGSAKILVRGRNFVMLFDRLNKNGVRLLNIEKINDKEVVITAKHKDCNKVFAICKNMWYNKLLGYGGFYGLLSYLKSNLFTLVCAVIFVCLAFVSDRFILSVDVNGVTAEKSANIYGSISKSVLFKPFKYTENAPVLISYIYKNFSDVDFVTVKKSGNRLIIDIIRQPESTQKVTFTKGVAAGRSGKLKKLSVYSGTAVKSVGDDVLANENLALGYYLDKSGNRIETGCLCSYVIECTYLVDYVVNADFTDFPILVERAIADGNISDDWVKEASISKAASADRTLLCKVKITYLFSGETEVG